MKGWYIAVTIRIVCIVCILAHSLAAAFAAELSPTIPIIYMGNTASPKNVIQFFWSPSCPFCATTFKNTIAPLMAENGSSGQNLFVMILLVRNDIDLSIANILTCVGKDKFVDAAFETLANNTGNGLITNDGQMRSFLVERKFLKPDQTCSSSQETEILGTIHDRAIGLGIKDTPGLIINGALADHVYFRWQLQEMLK